MEAQYEKRKPELLDECKVAPEIFEHVVRRLDSLMEPNVESIAYRCGQERLPLQWFSGYSDWDRRPFCAMSWCGRSGGCWAKPMA
jgi:hypothetical protein